MLSSAFFRAFTVIIKRPVFFIPFLLVLIAKWIWAAVLFYSVQWPFKLVLAPIIKRFWGIGALHYPGHIFWMYRILKAGDWFFDVILGSIASYFLITWLWRYFSNERVRVKLSIAVVYIIFTAILFLLGQKAFPALLHKLLSSLPRLSPKYMIAIFVSSIVFFNSFLQTLFVYSFISIAVTPKVSAFLEGFKWLSRLFAPTLLLLICAFSLYVPFIYLEKRLMGMFLVVRYPEALLGYQFLMDLVSVIINTLAHAVLVSWFYEVKHA